MKARLIFDLETQEDQLAHLRCLKSLDLALCLWEFQQRLDRICDESEDGKHLDERVVSQAFYDCLLEYGINLTELIQ
jgi:hypothetical protein